MGHVSGSERLNSHKELDPRDELREKAAQLKAEVKDIGSIAKAAAVETATEMKDKGMESISHLGEAVKEYKGTLEKYIKDSPTRSILMGLGAGIVLGLWVSRQGKV